MGVFYDQIPPSQTPFLLAQRLLFVGTSPLSPNGHVNISPKAITPSNFGLLSPTQFWYLDLSGSGTETLAHLHEPRNARLVIMFVAFTGPPEILRLWGRGTALEYGTQEYDAFVQAHKVGMKPGARSIIRLEVEQVAASCGFSIPFMTYTGPSYTLDEVFAKRAEKYAKGFEAESMDRYWAYKSQLSIDGLPGMRRAVAFAEVYGVAPLKKMVGRAAKRRVAGGGGVTGSELGMVLLVAMVSLIIGVLGTLTMISPEVVRLVQSKAMFLAM